MQMLLPVHVAAGGLAIVLGAVALLVKKGGTVHRRSGLLFVCAMIAMGTTALVLELLKERPSTGNVYAALLTAYLVATALTTVRPASRWARGIDLVALPLVVLLALAQIADGVKIFNSPGRSLDGVPFFMPFIPATLLLLAAAGDVRVLRLGVLRGGRRLARHLWRMCFALFIATFSFLVIPERVAKILPEPFATGPMRLSPLLLILGAMFYWLWRVRGRRALPVRRDESRLRAVGAP